jgi:hypothetical protein
MRSRLRAACSSQVTPRSTAGDLPAAVSSCTGRAVQKDTAPGPLPCRGAAGPLARPYRALVPRRALTPLLAALPALFVAAAGTTHPIFLEVDTAETWRRAHLFLLPGFFLVGATVWFVLRGERGPAAWGARALGASYAVLYLALDAIAGIGAPQQVIRTAERGDPFPPIGDLYEIGDQLGALGVYGLGAAGILAGAVLYLRSRSPLAPVGAAVLAVASYFHLEHHVFPSRGVLAMVGIAVGFALLEAARGTAAVEAEPQRVSSANSSSGP